MEHLVVVGNGMVGHHFIAHIISQQGHLNYRITVIGEERYAAYDRVQLSSLFSGNSHDSLMLGDEEWYKKYGVELVLGSRVTDIDKQAKRITLDGEDILGYDHLVLATAHIHLCHPLRVKTETMCSFIAHWTTFLRFAKRVKARKQGRSLVVVY
ncbi:nitrite reductase [NAD(P)H] large subunit [Vibrio variabilis]|uniref:Nitrite reductase [NAD(P)H] large subunit n=1 Tax=Vibrio variabilis TaxID=990271 RepID=A0ABQ0JAV7_9VIBR|nr:nitrite reductase [NAD(P)H] large subunit [Vibrio variabilis]